MSFTPNNNLERPPEGQADWDSTWNANIDILDRGFHGKFTTGVGVNTGDILWPTASGTLLPYNSRSLSLRQPLALSYKAVASGVTDYFLLRGIVTSVGIWSGNIKQGEPVYVSPTTIGFAVKSYAAFPIGMALRNEAIYFAPSHQASEKITQVQSLGPFAIGSTHAFTLNVGHRGFVRKAEVVTSFNLWTMKFHSGSTRVSSELLFESQSGGVTSTYLLDAAGFPYENTDTSSPGLIFGNVAVNSGVGSAYFNVAISVERMR